MWNVLLYRSCFSWIINKAVLASDLAEIYREKVKSERRHAAAKGGRQKLTGKM